MQYKYEYRYSSADYTDNNDTDIYNTDNGNADRSKGMNIQVIQTRISLQIQIQ